MVRNSITPTAERGSVDFVTIEDSLAMQGYQDFGCGPAALPHDLIQITEGLVPELRRRGLFRTAYQAETLRGLLGLARPANRYAVA
jgi:hypothetical protein